MTPHRFPRAMAFKLLIITMFYNVRKINEGGISSTALSLTDTVNKMHHRLMNATLPLSFNLFVIGS